MSRRINVMLDTFKRYLYIGYPVHLHANFHMYTEVHREQKSSNLKSLPKECTLVDLGTPT